MRPQPCVALSRLSVMRHEVGGGVAGSVGLILGLVAHGWFPLCGFDSRDGHARRGKARHGEAGHGKARDRWLGMVVALFDSVPEHGQARQGWAWRGSAGLGAARPGKARQGIGAGNGCRSVRFVPPARLGGARRGGARQGKARQGRARDRGSPDGRISGSTPLTDTRA